MGRRREGVAEVHLVLPAELCEEWKRLAAARGVPLSRWVEEAIREKLERERARALFVLLPPAVRDKLLGAAGGDELEAARLFGKILDRALEEAGGANQQLPGAKQQPKSRPF